MGERQGAHRMGAHIYTHVGMHLSRPLNLLRHTNTRARTHTHTRQSGRFTRQWGCCQVHWSHAPRQGWHPYRHLSSCTKYRTAGSASRMCRETLVFYGISYVAATKGLACKVFSGSIKLGEDRTGRHLGQYVSSWIHVRNTR